MVLTVQAMIFSTFAKVPKYEVNGPRDPHRQTRLEKLVLFLCAFENCCGPKNQRTPINNFTHIRPRSNIFHRKSVRTKIVFQMGLGKAVWAEFWSKINSRTSPIDLDRFLIGPGRPKIRMFRMFREPCKNENSDTQIKTTILKSQ